MPPPAGRASRRSTGRRVHAHHLQAEAHSTSVEPRYGMQVRPNVQMATERICPGFG